MDYDSDFKKASLEIEKVLKKKNINISIQEISKKMALLFNSQQIFPLPYQRAMLIQLLHDYETRRRKEVIYLQELDSKEMPVTFVLGALAEDWPGMSNSIIGIVHHKARNVDFIKGLSILYKGKKIGIVILAFKIASDQEYAEFIQDKKDLLAKIREAAIGSKSKFLLLEDETIKFEIYNNVVNKIKKKYKEPDIDKIIGESGEALKFISSRSREYLEERRVEDLANLIIDNFIFQEKIRRGEAEEVIKIKNFKTRYEKLTGITFVCKEILISIEDFLKTLNYIVPGHIIKHHKSIVTSDQIFIYRIEIVDRYGEPIKAEVNKSIEDSLNKLVCASFSNSFSQIKTIGGFEHYARAIIPFLMLELKKTEMTQVFIKVDNKDDFSIDIKLVVVSFVSTKDRIYTLMSKLESLTGIEINSTIPPKVYSGNVQIDIIKLNINLSEFSSVKEIFSKLKGIIKDIYGEIRDFDQGFREIDMKVLNELSEKLTTVDSAIIRDIFFNFDELYRIEIPFDLLYEVIKLCSKVIVKSKRISNDNVAYKFKNIEKVKRTLCIVSYVQKKTLVSTILNELKECDICFSKVKWDQRTYIIMIIHKGNEILSKESVKELKQCIMNNC